MGREARARASTPEAKLRNAVRRELHRQIDDFLKLKDPDSGMDMLDVLCAHMAVGFGVNIGVQVRHPDEQPEEPERPKIEIVR